MNNNVDIENTVFTTQKLICKRCGNEFDFYPQEQKHILKKGYKNPIFCRECRQLRKKMNQYKCVDCNATFELSVLQEEYYKEHNLKLPIRCEECRKIKKKCSMNNEVEETF